VYGIDLFAPLALRRAMRLPKKPSAGGVSRFAQAQLERHRLTGDPASLARARELTAWLSEHPGRAPVGKGWGLPFDWQAFVATPADTAIGHTTMNAVNAFLDLADLTGDEQARSEAEAGCEFLTKGLIQTLRPSGAVALSYTPLDKSQVCNTNAEIAAVLVRAGRLEDQELAWRVADFVLEAQNADGSWFYSAPDAGEGRLVVDHYHTGMILCALVELAEHRPEHPGLVQSLDRALRFHLDGHFDPDGCPRMRPHARYPIDAYSAGQSLMALTACLESPHVDERLKARCADTLDRLLEYAVTRMMARDGCFYYRKWKLSTMRLESLRCAQSLLCHALALVARTGRAA
jgi:hypothetical protein